MRLRHGTWRRFLPALALLFGLLAGMPGSASAGGQSGDFDLYILSLSWSPEYCAAHRDDQAQCAADRHFGLVVHGLWPQYATPRRDPASGRMEGWPASCPGSGGAVAPDAAAAVWPSPGLYRHEWQTHGTCTGLDPADYVDLAGRLRQRVQLPAMLLPENRDQTIGAEALRGAIMAANPGLTPGDLALVCHRARLAEIRLCLARDGDNRYVTCPATVSSDAPCPPSVRIRGLSE